MTMRVLVVEDDEDFMRALRWRLRRADPTLELIQSLTPADGIGRLVDGEAFDFVLSDLMFHGCASGEDVIAAAKRRGIPAILCSDLLELFGPEDMIRKVSFLEAPWKYMVERMAEAARACSPCPEPTTCG